MRIMAQSITGGQPPVSWVVQTYKRHADTGYQPHRLISSSLFAFLPRSVATPESMPFSFSSTVANSWESTAMEPSISGSTSRTSANGLSARMESRTSWMASFPSATCLVAASSKVSWTFRATSCTFACRLASVDANFLACACRSEGASSSWGRLMASVRRSSSSGGSSTIPETPIEYRDRCLGRTGDMRSSCLPRCGRVGDTSGGAVA